MKTERIADLVDLVRPEKKVGQEIGGGVDFQKILKDVQEKRQAADQKSAPSESMPIADHGPIGGPLSVFSYTTPPFLENGQPRAEGIRSADQMLGILEQYQKAMADPEVSLKSLYAYIRSLSHRIQDMSGPAERLPENDPLKKILADIGVLAAVEVEKFQRGDYIS